MENFSLIILAGGKSTRMGQCKANIRINGETMLDRIIGRFQPCFDDIICVADQEIHSKLSFQQVNDVYKNLGPLAGIYSGLLASKNALGFIVTIDMPFLNPAIFKFLRINRSGAMITIPVFNGKPQPLCGIYDKKCTEALQAFLKAGNRKVLDFFEYVSGETIEITKNQDFYSSDLFFNMNTLIDLEYLISKT